jgi:predicted neuraminidase
MRLTVSFATLLLSIPIFSAELKQQLIFPPEKWHNHSSSIVELPNGDLFVCWYHGSGERTADDVLIEGARLRKGHDDWESRFVLADTPGFPDTNPVMFVDSKQRLYFFWAPIIANEWHTALLKYRIATDLRKWPIQWTHQDDILLIPKNIVSRTREVLGADSRYVARAEDKYFSRMGWFGRIHPLELPSGRILLPLYSDGYSFSLVAISDDRGINWTASEPMIGHGGIQPSLVLKKDNTIVAYMRDNGPPPKRVQVSYSKDDGVSWSAGVDTDIPNPGVSIEAIRLKSGNWLMVYNDLESGRYSLCAALSDDEGATWKWKRHLDRSDNKKNQYHYPSVIQAKDGSIHATYSYHVPEGQSIKHVQFSEEWVKAGE